MQFLLTHSLARLRTLSLRSLGSLGKPAIGQLALAKLLLQFTRDICFANKFSRGATPLEKHTLDNLIASLWSIIHKLFTIKG